MLIFSNDISYKDIRASKSHNRFLCLFPIYTFFIAILIACINVKADTLTLPQFKEGVLGKHVQYFQEEKVKLTLFQAQQFFTTANITAGSSNSISLGIDVAPVWIKFSINNNTALEEFYRLSIETPWLDYIDTWLVNDGKVIKHIQGGDAFPFENRPMPYRFYAFEHAYFQGKTDVYIRIETKGPMAIPVYFSSVNNAINRDIASSFQYGILY
ncbi:MAG: hypothetical protein KC484_11310, partial [Colwelliaceae bacterium]|nr:hypothetical protein [Colwelliaceae bacterium]